MHVTSSRGSHTLSWPLWASSHVCTYPHTDKHNLKWNLKKNTKKRINVILRTLALQVNMFSSDHSKHYCYHKKIPIKILKDVKRRSQPPHSLIWYRSRKQQEPQVHGELRVATTPRRESVRVLSLWVGYGVYCLSSRARHKPWNLHTSDTCHWVRIMSKQTCFPEHKPLGTLSKHNRNAGLVAHAWYTLVGRGGREDGSSRPI